MKIPPKFEGDGRTKVIYSTAPIGTDSRAVTKAQARMLIHMLYDKGSSNHSAAGNTLWVSLEALHYNRTPYILHYVPSGGWRVEIVKSPDEVATYVANMERAYPHIKGEAE